ncbi:MAG: hypothetical protein PHV93_00870 [Candidatus Pacebacteria bacterium]|nr:hypothetical protein [Candidatus Paceibacterota bacterium]
MKNIQTTEVEFAHIFERTVVVMKDVYGLKVEVKHLDPSIMGDFNGVDIFVREDLSAEIKLFILAHLFGHSIQFNISERLRTVGMTEYTPHNVNAQVLKRVKRYEYDASRFALTLFHNIGIYSLDQWLSDWVAADWSYLQEIYVSGRKEELTAEFLHGFKEKYFLPGQPLLTPLPIPKFKPQVWESRFSF